MANTDMRWNALGPSPVDLTLDGNNQDSHDINKKVKCRCLSRHILEFVLVLGPVLVVVADTLVF